MSGWGIIPSELGRVPTAQERRKAVQVSALGRTISMLVGAVSSAFGVSFIMWVYAPVALLVPWSVLVVVYGAIAVHGLRTTRRKLRIFLNSIGVPTCVACGHDVRRIASDNCPECGADLAAQRCWMVVPPDADPRSPEASWRATQALARLRAGGWAAIAAMEDGLQVSQIPSRSGASWTMETMRLPAGEGAYSSFIVQVAVLTAPTGAPGSTQLARAEGRVPALEAGGAQADKRQGVGT